MQSKVQEQYTFFSLHFRCLKNTQDIFYDLAMLEI